MSPTSIGSRWPELAVLLVGQTVASLTTAVISVAAPAVGHRLLPAEGHARATRLDLPGVLLLTASTALVIVGLAFSPATRWPVWTRVAIAASAVVFVVFVLVERRTPEPLLDLRLLAAPGVAPALLVVFVLMGGYGTLLYTMSAYLQDGHRFTVLESGLVFVAYATAFGLVNITWARLPARLHRWISPAAVALLCLAEAALGVLLAGRLTLGAVMPLLAVAGAGHGAGFGALVDRVAARVPARHTSAFSGLINTITQLSILIGIAVLGGFYLAAARSGGPRGYATAMSGVCLALAVAAAVALACTLVVSLRLPDPPRDGPPAH